MNEMGGWWGTYYLYNIYYIDFSLCGPIESMTNQSSLEIDSGRYYSVSEHIVKAINFNCIFQNQQVVRAYPSIITIILFIV